MKCVLCDGTLDMGSSNALVYQARGSGELKMEGAHTSCVLDTLKAVKAFMNANEGDGGVMRVGGED